MVSPVVIQTAKAMDCIRTMMTDAKTLRNGDMIALDDNEVGLHIVLLHKVMAQILY